MGCCISCRSSRARAYSYLLLGSDELESATIAWLRYLPEELNWNPTNKGSRKGFADNPRNREDSGANVTKPIGAVEGAWSVLGMNFKQLMHQNRRHDMPYKHWCDSEQCRKYMQRIEIRLAEAGVK